MSSSTTVTGSRARWRLCLALAVFALCSFGARLAAASVQPVVRYDGPISSAGVASLEQRLTGRGQTLVIASSGGNALAALRLANWIHAHQVKVIADKYCLSACASYVLPAGYSATVRPNTLVGFHSTLTSTYLVARSYDPELAERRYAAGMRAESRLYRTLRLNPILLTLPLYRMGPVCAFVLRSKTGMPQDVLIQTKNTVYLPGRALMNTYGYPAADQLPGSEAELRNAYRLSLPPTAKLLVRTDFASADRSVSAPQIERALLNVPVCTAEAKNAALAAWQPPPD